MAEILRRLPALVSFAAVFAAIVVAVLLWIHLSGATMITMPPIT